MLQLLQPIAFRALPRNISLSVVRRTVYQQAHRSARFNLKPLALGCALTVSALFAFQSTVHLDAALPELDETGMPRPLPCSAVLNTNLVF